MNKYQNKMNQNETITSKINTCCLYYFLTQCNQYEITINTNQLNNTNEFIYVDKITKGNETVFDAQLISSSFFGFNEVQKLRVLKQCQMMKIMQWFGNETGIQIQQINNDKNRQIEYKISQNGIPIELNQFINEYYHRND